jgi:DNA-binding protein H-NS
MDQLMMGLSTYRSPSGETWAGRGARPRWMVEALKKGKKMEDFLIHKAR